MENPWNAFPARSVHCFRDLWKIGSSRTADRPHRPRDGLVGIEVGIPRLDGGDGEAQQREGRLILRPAGMGGVGHGEVEDAGQRDLAIGRPVGVVSGLPWRVNEHGAMKAPPDTGGNTLDELLALNYRVYGHCRTCGRSAVIDLAKVTARVGGAVRVGDLAKRMRCSGCGGLGVEVSIAGR